MSEGRNCRIESRLTSYLDDAPWDPVAVALGLVPRQLLVLPLVLQGLVPGGLVPLLQRGVLLDLVVTESRLQPLFEGLNRGRHVGLGLPQLEPGCLLSQLQDAELLQVTLQAVLQLVLLGGSWKRAGCNRIYV